MLIRTPSAVALLACLAVAMLTGTAAAQAPAGGFGNRRDRMLRHPTTSPYLNLLRPQFSNGGLGFDSTLPLDYYQLVRPQQEFRNAFQRQEAQIDTLRQRQGQLAQEIGATQATSSQLGTTGHPTSFLNLGGYFPGGVGGGGAGVGIGGGGAGVGMLAR